jgi:hypothetical protein
MSKNLYLDETTKDLTLTINKNLKLTSTLTEFVSQKIENLLSYFYEEWFLNYEGGIPYFEKIFTKNPDLNLVNTILLRQIKTIDEIIEIIKFETTFDTSTRTFLGEYEVKASDGEIVEGTFSL